MSLRGRNDSTKLARGRFGVSIVPAPLTSSPSRASTHTNFKRVPTSSLENDPRTNLVAASLHTRQPTTKFNSEPHCGISSSTRHGSGLLSSLASQKPTAKSPKSFTASSRTPPISVPAGRLVTPPTAMDVESLSASKSTKVERNNQVQTSAVRASDLGCAYISEISSHLFENQVCLLFMVVLQPFVVLVVVVVAVVAAVVVAVVVCRSL